MNNTFQVYLYNDPLNERKEINQICKNLQGCYIWVNQINFKRYAGSSMNLSKRLTYYYQHKTRKISYTSLIYNALNFHGLENFSLIIISMPGHSVEEVLKIEQFLLDFYNPEYNILKIAGSSKGLKLSPETIALLSERMKGTGNPRGMLGKTHSLDSIKLMSEANKGENNPKSKKVFVYSKDNLTELLFEFSTYTEAGKYFNCNRKTISNYIDNDKIYQDKWVISSTRLDNSIYNKENNNNEFNQ